MTEADTSNPRRATRIDPPPREPSAAWTRRLEDVLAQIVGRLERRLDRLERELATEHRLSALEGRRVGPVLDPEVLDLPADFRLRGGQ
jgi:hypothetical protein